MKSNCMNASYRRASGFSLLELLVTLVILSIGLLGLGLMQTTGLGLTKTAYARTQAMMLASDIADRVRANELSAANYVGTSAGALPACIAGATCNGAQIAASDMADWSNRLAIELPGGTGKILDSTAAAAGCPGNAGTTVAVGFMRVIITWSEVTAQTAATNLTGGEGGDCYQFDFAF